MNDFKFELNGLNWMLHLADGNHAALCSDDPNKEVFGMTQFKDLQVFVDSTLDYVQFRRTVEHELTHVFAYSYAVNLDMADEEQVADFISAYADNIYHLTERVCRIYEERGAVNADP